LVAIIPFDSWSQAIVAHYEIIAGIVTFTKGREYGGTGCVDLERYASLPAAEQARRLWVSHKK